MDLLDIPPIIDRLKARTAPVFRQIVPAAEMAALRAKGGLIASPSAAVLFLGEQADPVKAASGPMRQSLIVTFGVVVAVQFVGQLGGAGMAALAAPTGAVRGALFGWHHPQANVVLPLSLAGGGIDDFDPAQGLLFYRLDFSTQVRIQELPDG